MAERVTPPPQPQQQGEIPPPARGDAARTRAERPAPQVGDTAAPPARPGLITDWASI